MRKTMAANEKAGSSIITNVSMKKISSDSLVRASEDSKASGPRAFRRDAQPARGTGQNAGHNSSTFAPPPKTAAAARTPVQTSNNKPVAESVSAAAVLKPSDPAPSTVAAGSQEAKVAPHPAPATAAKKKPNAENEALVVAPARQLLPANPRSGIFKGALLANRTPSRAPRPRPITMPTVDPTHSLLSTTSLPPPVTVSPSQHPSVPPPRPPQYLPSQKPAPLPSTKLTQKDAHSPGTALTPSSQKNTFNSTPNNAQKATPEQVVKIEPNDSPNSTPNSSSTPRSTFKTHIKATLPATSSGIHYAPNQSSIYFNIPPNFGGLIAIPNKNDVLLGRGGLTNNHPGNITFRQLIDSRRPTYLRKDIKRNEKTRIAASIVAIIRSLEPPGRFLKRDLKTFEWLEVGDLDARKKASQALREDAPVVREKLGHDGVGAWSGAVTKRKRARSGDETAQQHKPSTDENSSHGDDELGGKENEEKIRKERKTSSDENIENHLVKKENFDDNHTPKENDASDVHNITGDKKQTGVS